MSKHAPVLALVTHHVTFSVGILGAILLTGCSGNDTATALPSGTATAPTLPSSSASAEADAVKKSYTNFIALLDHADTIPAGERREQLAQLMIEPQLSRVISRIDELKKKHLTSYGSVTVHITGVDLDGDKATVHDCQNSSGAGLMNSTTRKKVNRGVPRGRTQSYMVKGTDGRWRVSKYVVLGEGC